CLTRPSKQNEQGIVSKGVADDVIVGDGISRRVQLAWVAIGKLNYDLGNSDISSHLKAKYVNSFID
ncbi:hypothetical protein HHI36_008594, partial [Cryptolaemus montrouzieri]